MQYKVPTFYMIIGLPGSGKTRFAYTLQEKTDSNLVSLGEVRRTYNALYGRDGYRSCDMVNVVYEYVKDSLTQGKDVIYDATNLTAKNRKHVLRHVLRGIECRKVAYIMATPYRQCVKDCFFGETLAREGYIKWQTPGIWEGWDEIWLHYDKPEWIGCNGTPFDFAVRYREYDQESEHHGLTLGNHLWKTVEKINLSEVKPWKYDIIAEAALLHDCGKPISRHVRSDGKVTYYNHHNIGSYESLFFVFEEDIDIIYVSALIGHHMDPYFWGEDFDKNHYINFFGEAFYDDVMLIHKADKMAR